jgi:hypothetical protein
MVLDTAHHQEEPMNTIEQEIRAWLRSSKRHHDELENATFSHRRATRRLAQARETLEDAVAALYRDGSVQGRNKEERDALVRSLTSAQRLEVAEAEEAIDTATFALEHARASVNRDRQERHALQMRVVLAARYPDPMLGDIGTPSVPVEHESRRGMNTIEMMPLFELERAS